jgi:branched-chain amino acid transport system ATP-binding protein
MNASAAAHVLRFRHVGVRFGGVQALDAITFDVPPSTIFGIIGPNGAGKTTLFNCISGLVRPAPGSEIRYEGRDLVGLPVHRIAALGVCRTFQNISLIREQTVRENLLIGMHLALPYRPVASFFPLPYVYAAETGAKERIERVVELLSLPRSILGTRVDALSLGQQKKIEVARAIVRRPKLLLLDEPAGGLNDRETSDFAAMLRGLQTELGLSVVLIDHDMNLVMDLCSRLCVLSFGKLIAQGTPDEIQRDANVISVYLGDSDAA